jgi:hypothetical protein
MAKSNGRLKNRFLSLVAVAALALSILFGGTGNASTQASDSDHSTNIVLVADDGGTSKPTGGG